MLFFSLLRIASVAVVNLPVLVGILTFFSEIDIKINREPLFTVERNAEQVFKCLLQKKIDTNGAVLKYLLRSSQVRSLARNRI